MTIKKKVKRKTSKTPEAKEKRFLRLKAKRERAKENRKLEETQNVTGVEISLEIPRDKSNAESATKVVKKRKKKKSLELLSEAEKEEVLLRKRKERADRRARRKRSREKNNAESSQDGTVLVGGGAAAEENADGKESEVKKKKIKKKRRKQGTIDDGTPSNEPPAKVAKMECCAMSNAENDAASSENKKLVAEPEKIAGKCGDDDGDEDAAEIDAKIEKKRRKVRLLKEKKKMKKKLSKEQRVARLKESSAASGAGESADAAASVAAKADGVTASEVGNAVTVSEDLVACETAKSENDAASVVGSAAAKIEKKRQKMKALKERTKLKKKVAKEQKEEAKAETPVETSEPSVLNGKRSNAIVSEDSVKCETAKAENDAARVVGSAAAKIEKKRQKMKALKERKKLKKKVAKEQKEEAKAETPVEMSEPLVVNGKRSISPSVSPYADTRFKANPGLPPNDNKDDEFANLVEGLEQRLKNSRNASSVESDSAAPFTESSDAPEGIASRKSPVGSSTDDETERRSLADARVDAPASKSATAPPPTTSKSADLKAKLKSQLDGAKFRFINEKLYTMSSQEAVNLFATDEDAFRVYHRGYAQQVAKWPVNPVDVIIEDLKAIESPKTVVDFGCGEAKLARELTAHGVHNVTSYDLVAANELVTACDMRRCPLANESVDVAIFCLSLMGTNLVEFLREANRILKKNGTLKIAEVESRCKDFKQFLRDLQKCGFKMTSTNVDHKVFFLVHLKKIGDCKVSDNFPLALEPCYYKKR